MKEIEYWLNNKEREEIYSSGYWNNLNEEMNKPWWIVDRDFNKCINYLSSLGLISEFQESLVISGIFENTNNNIQVLDLAAGICWGSAILSKITNVAAVHAVEISEHRLKLLAPLAFEMMEGDSNKLFRYLGSFYNLKFQDKSIDYIFLSQAFHHAEYPIKLFSECDRVLKPGGKILLIGEHFISNKVVFKKILKSIILKREIVFDIENLFPPDDKLGDHYYPQFYYKFLIEKFGYNYSYKNFKDLKRILYIGEKTYDK